MTAKNRCPVCDCKNTSRVLNYQTYQLWECNVCSLQFISPFPTEQQLDKTYQEHYFATDKQGAYGYRNYANMQKQLQQEAQTKLAFLHEFVPKGVMLDVGAGTGVFITLAKKFGYDIWANDISKFACDKLAQREVRVIRGSLSKITLPKNKFDIVTAWDVFEHIPQINKTVKNIASSLKPGGILALTTPDTNSLDAKIFGHHWYGYKKIPEHLIFFNQSSINKLLEKSDLEILETKPWGFVRSVGFLLDRMVVFSPIFRPIRSIMEKIGFAKLTVYLPLTDFMIIAKKR